MNEFLSTDLGYAIGQACLILGVLDLTIGSWWLRRRQTHDELEKMPRIRQIVPLLFSFDIVLIAIGGYTLMLHNADHIAF